MMGADFYQTEAEIAALLAEDNVPIGIGKDTKIVNCIIDKNARIGKNVVITNKENVQEADRPSEGIYIRSGITVVLKNSVIGNASNLLSIIKVNEQAQTSSNGYVARQSLKRIKVRASCFLIAPP
ncbi:hypothetical protein K1719_037047 [Acacia pycnantha]|nr:hypothetical protein K1719_037047 [Acacia pycnantha]